MRKIIYFGEVDTDIQELLTKLNEKDILVEAYNNIAQGIKKLFSEEYSLVVLCDNMKDFDVRSLTHLIQESDPNLSINLISLIANNEDHLYFLKNGISDYLPIDCGMDVISEKIYLNANKQIDESKNAQILECIKEKLKLNTVQKVLTINNEAVHLSSIEFNILEYLLRHRNTTVSRQELLDEVWRDNSEGSLRIIDTYIKNIRKKTKVNAIITVRSMGYQWLDQ
ncbi:MAG: response regulator transcription factor [Erysipelotrichales bacterium]